jgi:hypothetical protein
VSLLLPPWQELEQQHSPPILLQPQLPSCAALALLLLLLLLLKMGLLLRWGVDWE